MKNTLFKGTIVRFVIQCNCADTGKTGDFFFRGDSHKEKESRVSPIFDNAQDLFLWSRKNFEPVIGGAYLARTTHEPELE